jgi:hypothetical protein
MFRRYNSPNQAVTQTIVLLRYTVILGSYYYLSTGLSATCFGVQIHHHQTVKQTIVLLRYNLLLGS